jgi:amino acid transporter
MEKRWFYYLFFLILCFLFGSFLSVYNVFAQEEVSYKDLDVFEIIDNITVYATYLLLIVGVIVIVVAGYNFVLSEGDPDKVKKAKDMIIYTMIGIAVALLATAIIGLVRHIVGA